MRASRFFLWAMAAVIVLTIAAPLVWLILPWLPVALLVAFGMLALGYCVVSLGCAVALESGRSPRLMRSGIVVAAIAFAGWLVLGILEMANWEIDEVWPSVLAWPTTWACLMMLIGLLLLPTAHRSWWKGLRRSTMAILALLAAFICLAITFQPDYSTPGDAAWLDAWEYEEIASRIGGVLTLLAAGSTAATFLAWWLTRMNAANDAPADRRPYWLQCPRCAAEQHALTGLSSCTSCRLRIRVELS